LLLEVEWELVFLPLEDDVARVEELDLGGAFESALANLRNFCETFDDLSVVATVEDVVDELKHVNALAIQQVAHVGA